MTTCHPLHQTVTSSSNGYGVCRLHNSGKALSLHVWNISTKSMTQGGFELPDVVQTKEDATTWSLLPTLWYLKGTPNFPLFFVEARTCECVMPEMRLSWTRGSLSFLCPTNSPSLQDNDEKNSEKTEKTSFNPFKKHSKIQVVVTKQAKYVHHLFCVVLASGETYILFFTK